MVDYNDDVPSNVKELLWISEDLFITVDERVTKCSEQLHRRQREHHAWVKGTLRLCLLLLFIKKSGRFKLKWPFHHKKASLTFRLVLYWNICVMKKGWDEFIIWKQNVWAVWKKSKHGSRTKAFIIGLIEPDVMDHANVVHPRWCTWLHFACLVGQTSTPSNFIALPSLSLHILMLL